MNRRFVERCALVVFALGVGPLNALAACPSAPSAERYTLNGAEVTDKKTGLVWARCSVGQSWSGSACTGTPTTHTHEQALALAQATTGWRLPNMKELGSIADKGCQHPAIDSTAFPDTLSDWYWTSSPQVGDANIAWIVSFYDGVINVYPRQDPGAVRLVRSSQ